ncbi:MAG: hypothetical protein V4438_03595 [Patescibacteria group bacterium]
MNFSINSFFEKYKHLKNPKDDKIRIAIIISDVLGIEIGEELVEIKKDTLSIKADSYLKTEIFMRKDKILEALNQNKFFITEIR